jgi:hypothetical protein
MVKLSAIAVRHNPFWLLWCNLPRTLRLKMLRLKMLRLKRFSVNLAIGTEAGDVNRLTRKPILPVFQQSTIDKFS